MAIPATSRDAGAGPPVQSVSRALALLLCFIDDDQQLTLTDLARRTEMSTSTALRLLRTLTIHGFLSRAEGSDGYVRGPALAALAQRSFLAGGFGDALRHLQDLSDELGESVGLGCREGACTVTLLQATSDDVLRVAQTPGARLPLHASAAGKVLLAYGDEPLRHAVDRLGLLVAMTPATITDTEVLLGQLEEVRDEGYAVSDEETYRGVVSLAVPVPLRDGRARAVVSVDVPTARFADDRSAALVGRLTAAAAQLAKLPMMEEIDRVAPWSR